ncbi:MAG: hypothetical protein MR383_07925 [Lachnospiraceae bacterium]|nr:hypothetical protein [Lachnospiraceae bacterium]MDD7026312.1 hypothetical protein [Lachnospiraceae bacterium]
MNRIIAGTTDAAIIPVITPVTKKNPVERIPAERMATETDQAEIIRNEIIPAAATDLLWDPLARPLPCQEQPSLIWKVIHEPVDVKNRSDKSKSLFLQAFSFALFSKKLLILKMIYDIVLISYNSDCQLTILHGHHAHSKHEALRFVSQFISPGLKRKERKEETEKIIIFCNYSEPCKFTFCECLHSNRIVNLYGEVTT